MEAAADSQKVRGKACSKAPESPPCRDEVPEKFAAAKASGTQSPSLHSSFFAPNREPTIKTAITTEVIGLRELMPPKSRP